MKEKHTVHCRNGGKVVIDGDRVEIHMAGPIVVRRKEWIVYLTPAEEARRALDYAKPSVAQAMLEEAFTAVRMTVHSDPSDDR